MELLEISVLFTFFAGRLLFRQGNKSAILLKRMIPVLLLALWLPEIREVLFFILFMFLLIATDLFLLPGAAGGKYYLLLVLAVPIVPTVTRMATWLFSPESNPVSSLLFSFFNGMPLFRPLFLPDLFRQSLLIATGFIFTVEESTLLIRGVLNAIKAVPEKNGKKRERDEEEYNRGRLIGILERTFIYFLTIFGQYAAIGIVLALKSLARFKELDDRNFAEYFLIGSLLSVLFGVLPALVVMIYL